MKRFIKSYHVFLSPTWLQLLVYVVYPLLLIGLMGMLIRESAPIAVCIPITGAMIVLFEIWVDVIVFGGISSKDTNKLEYLKTSVRGMSVLRKGVIADGVRRCISVIIIFTAIYGMAVDKTEYATMLASAFLTLACVELGLILSRRFPTTGALACAISIGEMLCIEGIQFLYSDLSVLKNICIAYLPYLLLVTVGRIIILRKARRSYYDK